MHRAVAVTAGTPSGGDPLAMLFNDPHFALFFASVFGLYVVLRRRLRVQNLLLLVASYVFYGWWDWRFLSLIWLSTAVDYVCALALDRRRGADGNAEAGYLLSPGWRRAVLGVSLVANLGVLGVFKYLGFFVDSLVALMARLGVPFECSTLNVILPVGISFYTLQTLSYTIDVYRGQSRAHRSLVEFALFVAFFPQLVAGPIVRARELLPQISRPRCITRDQLCSGAYLFFWGLFKKAYIADGLARYVERGFDVSPDALSGDFALIAVYAFAWQIYCDFSGYTDMARGLGRVMGFSLPGNFNMPYFAANPADFWRRWHITLSSWLRDYLYIPLGGNRLGRRRTCVNALITMVACGLWHGAAWTFVAWGAFHGLLLVAYRLIEPGLGRLLEKRSEATQYCLRAAGVLVFFHLTCLGWMLFRAHSIEQVVAMLGQIFTPWLWWLICGAIGLGSSHALEVLPMIVPLLLLQWIQHVRRREESLLGLPAPLRAVAYSAMFYCLVWYGAGYPRAFIYFQF